MKKPDFGGGLALIWKEEFRLEVINYTDNHVLAKVVEDNGFQWFFYWFLWLAGNESKTKSWALLRHLSSLVNVLWCCVGDFNAFLHFSKKLSIHPPSVK